MAYEGFTVGNSTHSKSGFNRKFIIISVAVLVIGLGAGILIGHFAIEKSSDNSGTSGNEQNGVWLEGVPEAIIREADPRVTEWILNGINNENIAANLRNLTASPHIAGTPQDFTQADMLRQFWLDVGLDSAVTTPYNILLSYPEDTEPNILSLLDNNGGVVMESPAREENLTAEDTRDDIPFPNLGYSANGTVEGMIWYVNYARESDFQWLEDQGLNVSGHIVLARYGKGGRSGKVKRAEERGAIGVVLYSDPADYIAANATTVYPDSWWIPPSAASRGSILRGTGDPLTPGYPAIASAYHYAENNTKPNLPKIPAMPIGYDYAEKILMQLGGSDVPDGWSGRLNVTYRIGGSFTNATLKAKLSVHMRNERRTAYNAFGLIRGETEPDRYVMLGNHRDSWVLGAVDPSSGTATMMELSRVLGQLVKEEKWRPRRTIIFCSWGAEEFGLIGSTEWVEENIKSLESRAIAYINMDIAITGNYTIRGLGSPPVFRAMYSAAAKVENPDTQDTSNPTVLDSWTERRPLLDPVTEQPTGYPIINTPGGGSDYGPFIMFGGITCADFRYDYDFVIGHRAISKFLKELTMEFMVSLRKSAKAAAKAGENLSFYPLYHTTYETFNAVSDLMDPGFVYHGTVAKLSGELLRDLADSKLLPYNMTDYYLILNKYRLDLKEKAPTDLTNYVNTTQLDEAIELYRTEAENFQASLDNINLNNPFELRRVNDQMMMIDRAFIDPAGLPSRSQDNYYKNIVHSSAENSFNVTSFPGITDALYKLQNSPDDRDLLLELEHHFSVVVFTIQSAAYSLKETYSFLRDSY